MFRQAVLSAGRFTFPFVGLRRRRSGEIHSTMGAFIVVNSDGWVLTAKHLVDEIAVTELESSGQGEAADPCIDHAEIWAVPGFAESRPRAVEEFVRPLADLALLRLESFGLDACPEYPVFRDAASAPIDQGMSVCRFGYPFHNVASGWQSAGREFVLAPDAFPVPSFALDGIVSRFHRITAEDGVSATYIETSTPGLRGQSGGPLLDVEGRVCGVQSHTVHLDLGFDATFVSEGVTATERQFLNVGAASHVDEVRALLDDAGVSYRLG